MINVNVSRFLQSESEHLIPENTYFYIIIGRSPKENQSKQKKQVYLFPCRYASMIYKGHFIFR